MEEIEEKANQFPDRMEQAMKALKTNANAIAKQMGVATSVISGISLRKTKPSFINLAKILSLYPQISPDWFILGQGPMFRNEYTNNRYAEKVQFKEGEMVYKKPFEDEDKINALNKEIELKNTLLTEKEDHINSLKITIEVLRKNSDTLQS